MLHNSEVQVMLHNSEVQVMLHNSEVQAEKKRKLYTSTVPHASTVLNYYSSGNPKSSKS